MAMANNWPWMRRCSVALAAPFPPVNETDDRPAVKELIEKHREAIDEIQCALQSHPLFNTSKHDDLWILRFVLSHKRIKPALKAAQSTLQFRHDHRLDAENRRYWPRNSSEFVPGCEAYTKHCEADFGRFHVPNPQMGVVAFFQMASFDQHAMARSATDDDYFESYLYISEWCFQWIDYLTRTTGRLTKNIRIVDLKGLRLKRVSIEHLQREGQAVGRMEDCYPQALHGILAVNAPSWVQIPWALLRPLLPKRILTKIDFLEPQKRRKDLDKLLRFIDKERLPTRYGGENPDWPVEFPLPKI